MTTYYMTSRRASEVGWWEPCRATTLRGAKCEATRRYGAGYIDAALVIAEGDGETAPRHELATRSNRAGARWKDLPY